MNDTKPPASAGAPPPGLRRRGLLLAAPALLLAGALPSCAKSALRAQGAPAADETSLPAFLRLSALLTGFDFLSAEHGDLYLRSLLADPAHARALGTLYEKAGLHAGGSPATLEALTRSGVFADERLRACADKLTVYWYSGIYDGPNGPVVATYTDALGWKALTYTEAPSVCGGPMGFWAEPPRT